MTRLTGLFAILPALIGGLPAHAQDAKPPAIIVEEERPQDEASLGELGRALAGHPNPRRPLARFEQPVCLMVAASDSAFAKTVAERIIDNAKRAKAKVRGNGCKPNALVAFSDDARAQLQAIRNSGRRLFAGISPRELDAAIGGRDPAYVFQASDEKAASGQDFYRATPQDAPTNVTTSMGRLSRLSREDMLAALVVFDNGAIAGLEAEQVADYASLRLLAPTGAVDALEAGAPRTILALFASPAAAPDRMTRFDRAYLKALYAMPAGAFASEVLRRAVLDTARSGDEGDDQAEVEGE
jgi:hypothetical protein